MQRGIVLVLLLCISCAYSAIFSNALNDNMVLQRAPEKSSLWGYVSAGEQVTVTFDSKEYKSTADSTGAWQVFLDPKPAGGPYTITASTSAGDSASLKNVLFGDVYVCGGQSNMQFTVDSAFNHTEEVAAANNFPNIRVMTVGQQTTSTTPLLEFKTISHSWNLASSASIGVGNWSSFSAVCWFFGRDLYQHLDGKVPIGLLSDNWGGTIVQAWTSEAGLKVCNTTSEKSRMRVDLSPNEPSVLYNAMIVPILKMTIKGAIWYQGESNSGNSKYYACGFPEMIKDWRTNWNAETSDQFPFLFVQLAPWLSSNLVDEPLTRASQLVSLELPNVGFATAIDLGDPTSPFGSIHPRFKQPVGERLLLAARAINYGEKVQMFGPWANDWSVTSPGPKAASVRVTFYPDTIGQGLDSKPFPCPDQVPATQCAGFQIQSKSGKWFDATAKIVGDAIEVSADLDVAGVEATSYGWNNYPLATLWNKDNLPALPYYFPNPFPVHRN